MNEGSEEIFKEVALCRDFSTVKKSCLAYSEQIGTDRHRGLGAFLPHSPTLIFQSLCKPFATNNEPQKRRHSNARCLPIPPPSPSHGRSLPQSLNVPSSKLPPWQSSLSSPCPKLDRVASNTLHLGVCWDTLLL